LIQAFDVWIVAAFFIFAGLFHWAQWGGFRPYPFLGGDAANIACFAAVRDHPDLFSRDELLGHPERFSYYSALHIPALRSLAGLFGDYGSAFMHLLGPHVFVMALGFYVLGRTLFGSRPWAALFAIAALSPVDLNLWEFWGLWRDALPRFTFQAVLPFLLAAVWRWRDRPALWPLFLASAGLLVYVHPVSAPAWGLALWLSSWLLMPKEWSFGKKVAFAAFLGFAFLIVAVPFLLLYLGGHERGRAEDYESVYRILQVRIPGYLDVGGAARDFGSIVLRNRLAGAAGAGFLLSLLVKREDRRGVAFVLTWALGVAIVSFLVPSVEQAVARRLKRTPIETDLVRNFRYLVPLMILLTLWPWAALFEKFRNRAMRFIVVVIGLGLVGVWARGHPPPASPVAVVRSWMAGRLFPEPSERATSFSEVLTAVAERTPRGSAILPTSEIDALALRYRALRSVVYCFKDGGAMSYSDHEALVQWFDKYRRQVAIDTISDAARRLEETMDFARDLDADFVLGRRVSLPPEALREMGGRVEFANERYWLIRVLGER
jgi:hypothetical protein